ncbi:MAG: SusD/RagB family nutrient-binding outer membrane lipoprotein [Alistipes sp.]|nr:SusD/RagB family nutrient-binding outer membrane lipoprotein [Alistipes sp.]
MRKTIKYFAVILASAFVVAGCTKFDDMNKNPYALYEVEAESFVQPILYNTAYTNTYNNYYISSELMQYAINTSFETSALLTYNYELAENYSSYLWRLYKQFGNAQYMLELARKGDNPAMVGVALVLRSYVASILTDAYGDVPYFNAGKISLQGNDFDYTVAYDKQEDIYIDMLRSLEEANACFAEAKSMREADATLVVDFSHGCDYMYDGNIDKWHRFGNSLYLRLLMHAALKAQENGGVISLGDEYGDIQVIAKLNELYDCYKSGDGVYPMMRSISDSARVEFSSTDSALYTPFYSTTSGNWNAKAACLTFTDLMLIEKDNDKDGEWDLYDPRYFRIFTKAMGAPTQIPLTELEDYFNSNLSKAGNSLIGRFTRGTVTGTHTGDLQNAPSYGLLNYDELYFLFAEAGARGWLSIDEKSVKDLYLEGVRQSILQWQVGFEGAVDYLMPTAQVISDFIKYLDNDFDYNKMLEKILTQKYVATFWVGIESWVDYRRTGYPILKTNGRTAQNDGILPTRMRYPATEAFQNAKHYSDAVAGWLKGTDNMQTDVWWASTTESQSIRRLGRQ